MFKFTRTGVCCLFIIIIFCLMQIFIYKNVKEIELNKDIIQEILIEQEKRSVKNTTVKTEIWKIEIPKISLIANISEGTATEVFERYVGHFEITSKEQGNIGLAASNRGYVVNYFKDLKLLKEGDEIKYKHNQFEKIYYVQKCRIIKDTDWQYLEETERNMLTLITYVENHPEYRRCIQAVEREEGTN